MNNFGGKKFTGILPISENFLKGGREEETPNCILLYIQKIIREVEDMRTGSNWSYEQMI